MKLKAETLVPKSRLPGEREVKQGQKTVGPASIHPEVLALTGLVPADWDVEADHRQHLLDKPRPSSVGAVLQPYPAPKDDLLAKMLPSSR